MVGKTKKALPKILFQSTLERISSEANYFALSVPAKVSLALKTKGPIPVLAQINNSDEFIVSLFPVGGGRHYLRVKVAIREQAKIKEGDRVKVKISVRDRTDEDSIPADLKLALKEEDVESAFKALPIGQRTFFIRLINEAAKPETRSKRIRSAVEAAHERREKNKS